MTNLPPIDRRAEKLARQERKARRRQRRLAEEAAGRPAQQRRQEPVPAPQQRREPDEYSFSSTMGPLGQRIARRAGNMILGRIIGMILNAIMRGFR